jgi:hypothetical protein
MRTRYFSLVFGSLFLIAGILGFIPGLLTPPPGGAPAVAVSAFYGYLLSLFPVNALHNVVHLVLGLWGIAAWQSFTEARTYARGLTLIYAILAICGVIPGLDTIFGLVPLYSNDIWLHALAAIIAAYFGWAAAPAVTTAQQPR